MDRINMQANQIKYEKILELDKKIDKISEDVKNLTKIEEYCNKMIKEEESKKSFFGSIFNTENNQRINKTIEKYRDKFIESLVRGAERDIDKLKTIEERGILKKQMNVSFDDIEKYNNFNREEIEQNIASLSKELEELEQELVNTKSSSI